MYNGREALQMRVALILGAIVSAICVFGALYITWTPPGAATADGVQGRYFLPLALIFAALPLPRGMPRSNHIRQVIVGIVAVFPMATLEVVMRAVVLRYYLAG